MILSILTSTEITAPDDTDALCAASGGGAVEITAAIEYDVTERSSPVAAARKVGE
jgi:hypothetical protein